MRKYNNEVQKNFKKIKQFIIKNNMFFICFSLSFIILLLTYFIYYPGVFTYDGNYQWQQVQSGIINNAHPFFSTYFMYLLSKICNSITMIIIFQIILFSSIWAYFCNSLKLNLKHENIIKMLFTIILCLVPLIGIYNITLWKDVIYTDYLFLIGIFIFSWANNDYKLSNSKYISLGIILQLAFSYRHNGIIVSLLILFIFYFIEFIKYKKRLIIKKDFYKSFLTILSFIVLYIIILIPKNMYLKNYEKDNKEIKEVSCSTFDSYLVWMMGSHLREKNVKDKSDLEFLNNIIPIKEWKKVYNPYLINNTNLSKSLDQSYVVKNKTKFRKIFLKYLMKNPNTIIKHYLKSDALLFNPVSSINGYVYTYSFGELKYLPKYTKINTKIPVLKNLYDKYINLSLHKLFIIFYEPAFILYLSLIITITLSKKVYGKKIWLFITPMLMNTISLIPINLAQDLRYVYINYLTFFGLLLMFILNYSKILKKKRV